MSSTKPDISSLSPREKRKLLARLIREESARSPSVFPLSYGQQALWYLQEIAPESGAYNFMYAWWIRSELDPDALGKAFQGILDRHACLRTTYSVLNERPAQRVHSDCKIHFERIDAAQWSDAELSRRMMDESRRPFDLRNGPVFRVYLFLRRPGRHVLAICFHHIALDFWCAPLLLEELRVFYAAAKRGQNVDLPPLGADYSDFVRWQTDMLAGEQGRRLLSYWRERLSGPLPALNLPTDRPRPRVQTYRGAAHTFHVSGELTERLKAVARSEGTTLFTLLVATFQVLLHRDTGQEDVLLGSPTAGRIKPEFERVLGYFVNPIVLRTDLGDNPTFRAFLRQVRNTVLGALEHQAYPFGKLVEELGPPRDPGRSPIFDVMFVLQSMHRFSRDGKLSRTSGQGAGSSIDTATPAEPGARFELGDLVLETYPLDLTVAQFDLDLEMVELHGALAGRMNYNAHLFDRETIARLTARFEILLEAVATDPEIRIADPSLLPAAERHRLLSQWNDTKRPFPAGACVHELFEEQVARTPDAEAVLYDDQVLTFRALNRRANRLARRLRSAGVGPETRVGICLGRSWQMLAAILGVLKAGGGYVPLDPAYPRDRLAFMLEDAGIAVIVTEKRFVEKLPASEATCITMNELPESDDPHDEENLGRIAGPQNLAYVIYTSGSTGKPKGVMIEHRSVVNHNLAVCDAYKLSGEDRVLQFSSFNFDAPVEELFPTWIRGGCVVLRDQPALPSHGELHELIERYRLTVLNLSAAYWHEWVSELALAGKRLPSSLRSVSIGGEKPSRECFDTWLTLGGDRIQFVNTYGPTETTVIVTLFEPTAQWAAQHPGRDIPMGKPLPNTQVYVLDEQTRPVPIGVAGELHIGGVPLARGYLNRPELTARRFIPNPFGTTPGRRLYKTGDRVRFRADGQLEFIGRVDDQIKVRGFRIEPGEIEQALLRHEAITQAAVVAREEGQGAKRLVAYASCNSKSRPTTSELRRFLQSQLPPYMVPGVFVLLNELPTLANKKVNRSALPDPELSRPEIDTPFLAPQSPAEETLAGIWRALLELERVGVHDNFFELGGDSILSVQMVARANRAGLRLTARHVFQYQTIAQLAEVVGSARAIQAEQGPVTGPVIPTPIQQWFFEQDFAQPNHFNQAVLFEVTGPLEVSRLEAAVQQALVHHDALRMRFRPDESGFSQNNAGLDAAHGAPVVEQIVLTDLPIAERSRAIESRAGQVQSGLNLPDGPLIRVGLFRLGNGSDRLLIAVHHLVMDGVSWRILLEDLLAAYAQLRAGQSVELAPKTTSFQQWAERLEQYAQSEALDEEIAHWRGLAGQERTAIPVDHSDGPNDVASADTIKVSLPEAETRALLQDVPSAYRTQINDVLLTALVRAFEPWTGRTALLFDLEGHGREDLFEDVDLSRTVGWFTSMFPVRLDLAGRSGPGPALKSVKGQLRRIPRRGIGYGLLRYLRNDSTLRRELTGLTPEVGFNYLGQLDAMLGGSTTVPLRLADESPGPIVAPQNRRSHLIDINCGVSRGQLITAWTYSRNIHDPETIERLANAFLNHLRTLITHCQDPRAGGCTPSDFPLVRIAQSRLDALVGTGREIEDLYPLSPLQSGMLFHCRYAPDSDLYVSQFSCILEGDLDADALRVAWQRVVDRHGVLRTCFAWKGLDDPVQIVHRRASVCWQDEDWRHLSPPEQERRLARFLEADRARGFDLNRPQLSRVSLIRLTDSSWRIVSSNHHLVMDGWSLPLMLSEVMLFYEGQLRGQEIRLDHPRSYREYIAWLGRQNLADAEAFWRMALGGFTEPTILGTPRPAGSPENDAEAYGQQHRVLTRERSCALEQWARQHRLTINSIVQAAWGLLLSRYSGRTDVVFGSTVSGRSAPLVGIESMLGVFINTLPVRVRIPARDSVLDWLRDHQKNQADARHYEHNPLAQVQAWSEVPPGQPLFESLLVFENYPVDRSLAQHTENLKIRDVERRLVRTSYPLMLVVLPGPEMTLRIGYERDRFEDATIRRMLEHLVRILETLMTDPGRRVCDVSLLTPKERRRLITEWSGSAGQRPAGAPADGHDESDEETEEIVL